MTEKKNKQSTKVKCKYCKLCNLNDSFCTVKKASVALNKNRKCDKHMFDASLVVPKKELPTQRVQSWNIGNSVKRKDREALEKLRHTLMQQELKEGGGGSYPITGDLSRFKTTGT